MEFKNLTSYLSKKYRSLKKVINKGKGCGLHQKAQENVVKKRTLLPAIYAPFLTKAERQFSNQLKC